MATEIKALSCIRKAERSYHTPPGWRVATYEEAKQNLETIKDEGLLRERETARLLDGWIGGPGYNFQMGDDFRSFLGHMILIEIQSSPSYSSGPASSKYADVKLTDKGRQVALLLCSGDWNYEIVYWLLNSWDNKENFNPLDVREGKIPFSNKTTLVEMNMVICNVRRLLGEEGFAGQKAAKEVSGYSVKEVMISMGKSCSDKFSEKDKKILGQSFLNTIHSASIDLSENEDCSKIKWFQEFAFREERPDPIWNFLWYIISSYSLSCMLARSLCALIKEWGREDCLDRSQTNFIRSTAILYYLSQYLMNESRRILKQACKDVARGDWDHFSNTLENPSFATCDETGNYHVLNQILISSVWQEDSVTVNKVLECGAQPGANLGTDRKNMALYYAIMHNNNDIVRSLFEKCHSKDQFANAANEEGMTAVHWACCKHIDYPDSGLCEEGQTTDNKADVSILKILLEYGGRPDIEDNRGRLPLHYAAEDGESAEGKVDALIGSQDVQKTREEMVTWKDKDGVSPLDMAVKDNNIKLMLKLLSVSQQSLETYFNKVDSNKLLREFAYQGKLEAVKTLLERGSDPLASDEKGRTALHHASMCENPYNALNLTKLILKKCTSEEEKEKWVTRRDGTGKTALHFAAMKGHVRICRELFEIGTDIRKIRDIRDTDGRTPLYEAVERGHSYIIRDWVRWYIDIQHIVDNSGMTLLHVAASEGKSFMANLLLSVTAEPGVYVRTADILGQTALHKAAKGGHADVIKVLLHWGANPVFERDCDGRTVFHYFPQAQLTGDDGKEVAKLLLLKCGSAEKKLLLLWASAAGLGTIDEHLSDSPLKAFLLQQKEQIAEELRQAKKENNLLRIAARLGDIEMTKELLSRGAQIGDIKDHKWKNALTEEEKDIVDTILKQIESIAEEGNDRPTTSDNLGRSDFAHGLAALLLNPYLKPPITVGISGSWGMGKSSLMVQTEGILLKTAAQLALLPSEITYSQIKGASFPGFQILEHSEKGQKKYHQIKTSINLLLNDTKSQNKFCLLMKNKIVKWWNKISGTMAEERDSVCKFLNKYEAKYHHAFKSLAAMDSRGMFKEKGQQSPSETDSITDGGVPAILTVRYNAWKYKNESEALAGMAVEITKEMEGIMTDAQWLSTCFRNTWRKEKSVIVIQILFPCLLAILLATTFTWVLWLLLDTYKVMKLVKLKYASFPLTIVIMVWTLVKRVMRTVHPVSVQLMNYIKLPEHSDKLGYQERVISDITFLKNDISKNPYFLCSALSYIWHFITGPCIIPMLSCKYCGEVMASLKPSANLRIIVFVDDLDRCQESVILQVLSSINLVLAVCEISVVLGMDKLLIQRAIMKKYGDKSLEKSKELADKYLQKIIQLPLDLPDPSEGESNGFLKGQLGVFEKQKKEHKEESKANREDDSLTEIEAAYKSIFTPLDRSSEYWVPDILKKKLRSVTSSSDGRSAEKAEAPSQTQTAERTAINIPSEDRTSDHSLSNFIPIRELLFVRYSEGERDAFCHFQKMATDFRKLPREWKRLLTYHRLVWYIFIINNDAKHLDGWQVQLITWIFICWEFEANINILVQRWKRIGILKNYEQEPREPNSEPAPREPSLRAIVESVISYEKDTAEYSKGSENKNQQAEKSDEEGKKNGAISSKNTEVPESSNMEQTKLTEGVNDQIVSATTVTKAGDYSEHREVAGTENLSSIVNESDGRLDKALMELDVLKKEIQELKELVRSQQAGRSGMKAEGRKGKSQGWQRLKIALGKYDVSMAGIQAFQRFRFYCEAGHLPWPLRQEEGGE